MIDEALVHPTAVSVLVLGEELLADPAVVSVAKPEKLGFQRYP